MTKITGDFKNIYQYTAAVDSPPYDKYRETEYAIITMSGKTEIEILFDCEVKNVVIRPISSGLEFVHTQNKVKVFIDRPLNFSVEINGSVENGVMVFADFEKSYELDKYDEVITFESGVHYADTIEIKKDNTAVFLKDGAYVHGQIKAENVNNFAIFGTGVLTMENYARNLANRNHLIFINNCQNIKISDVVITDSCFWSCKISGCSDVEIDNLKIIGCRGNSDGIDICGSKNVHVNRCFTRVWDDSLVVKAFDTGDVDNLLFENCTLWCDMARPIEVGVELRAESVKNVVFKNIDIIHSMCGYPVLGIHHGDRANVSDIVFEDIRIEDAPGAQLFDIRITDSVWNTDNKKGCISNIILKNISYIGKEGCSTLLSNSRLEGYSEEAFIDGVTLENVTVCGKSTFYDLKSGLDIFDYVKNVKLIPAKTEEKAGTVKTEIEVLKSSEALKDGMSEVDVYVTLCNTEAKQKDLSAKLIIYPKLKQILTSVPIEVSLKPEEKYTYKTKIMLPAGKFAFAMESQDASILPSYKYIHNELVLTENFSDCAGYVFEHSESCETVRFAIKDDLLMIESELLKEQPMNIYTALPTEVKDGEVIFSIRETDMGIAPALIIKNGQVLMSPQLRNNEEITYVFKNEPEIKNFKCTTVSYAKNGIVYISLDKIGIGADAECFLLEVELPKYKNSRYSCSLFGSQKPMDSAQMFVKVKRGE